MSVYAFARQVIQEIAFGTSDFDGPKLAVIYDEIHRAEIENKSAQMGSSFDPESMLTAIDECSLRRAKQ